MKIKLEMEIERNDTSRETFSFKEHHSDEREAFERLLEGIKEMRRKIENKLQYEPSLNPKN